MMAGGSMAYHMDVMGGREVGSIVRMSGRALGIRLGLEERVIERRPPARKV